MPSDSSDANSKKPTHLIVPVFAYFGNSWKLYKFETLHNFPRPSPSKKKVRKKSFFSANVLQNKPNCYFLTIGNPNSILFTLCSLSRAGSGSTLAAFIDFYSA